MRHAFRLAHDPRGGLINEDQFLLRQQGEIVATILVEVSHGQGRRPLDRIAGIDFLGTAEIGPFPH